MIITANTALLDQKLTSSLLGGKAKALAELQESVPRIPSWFVITPETDLASEAVKVLEHARSLGAELFAVRSSGAQEDGTEHSFAGQFSTKLFVSLDQLLESITEVQESNGSAHLTTYKGEKAIAEVTAPSVIVQSMLSPEVSGVAFSRNPISQAKGSSVVSALWGVGSALVSGEADADLWELTEGGITKRMIAQKKHRHLPNSSAPEGVSLAPVEDKQQNLPSLTDQQIQEVSQLARKCEDHFGSPQDIEWAYADRELYLLQSRPITTLTNQEESPTGSLTIWDNSNIAESYSGTTSPLTFSFAERAYEHVYREFCKILSVPEKKLREHDHVFPKMLGHIQGHVYYNLNSWYHVLALLPGFSINREFMEQMMGVKQAMPDEIVGEIIEQTKTSKFSDTLALLKTLRGLMRSHKGLTQQMEAFQSRLDQALSLPTSALKDMSTEELVKYYHSLESQLLKKWDAPLVNDFLAMIYYGMLGKCCGKWLDNPSLQNELLVDCGDIISAEPPRLMGAMAQQLAEEPDLLKKLTACDQVDERLKLINNSLLAEPFAFYLEKFGDRCMEELKLESLTLGDNPEMLIESIIVLAQQKHDNPTTKEECEKPKDPAKKMNVTVADQEEVYDLIAPLRPIKKKLFLWLLKHAKEKVSNRENLRFERTRLFGRVRQIMLQLGRHYVEGKALELPQDIFMLTLREALDHQARLSQPAGTLNLIAERYAEQESFFTPPDRFQTRGENLSRLEALNTHSTGDRGNAEQLQGTGACPGIVRGYVRVFRSPKDDKLKPGEILVAQQTDPGWVVLFPAASALLVERGSILSHSAIVARELQLPCVVSVPDITTLLKTGDLVEMNGATGDITILERANKPATEIAQATSTESSQHEPN